MNEPVLIVMAAGMGSRYGGLKQMDSVGNNGEWMIDYSLFDAHRAGFRDVVFIVRQEILEDFKNIIGKRIDKKFNINYVVQRIDDIPEGYLVPEERTKPWGTGHAVYSARNLVSGRPIMAINADDYYGPHAYKAIYDHLKAENQKEIAMVGYMLKNTVSENGHVARGVCQVDENGHLLEIVERTNIRVFDNMIKYSEDEEKTWNELGHDTIVSLNCWGFTPVVLEDMKAQINEFFAKNVKENPCKVEFFLPSVVEKVIEKRLAKVKVLTSEDKWYGVTYQEDKKSVSKALDNMKEVGLYPQNLWE